MSCIQMNENDWMNDDNGWFDTAKRNLYSNRNTNGECCKGKWEQNDLWENTK